MGRVSVIHMDLEHSSDESFKRLLRLHWLEQETKPITSLGACYCI